MESSTRTCPFCREEIHAGAIRCRHCHADVQPFAGAIHGGVCPYCREEIAPGALVCKHCRSPVAGVPSAPLHDGECPFCKEQIARDAMRCKHCGSQVHFPPDPARKADCGCGRGGSDGDKAQEGDAMAMAMAARQSGTGLWPSRCTTGCRIECAWSGLPSWYCWLACAYFCRGGFGGQAGELSPNLRSFVPTGMGASLPTGGSDAMPLTASSTRLNWSCRTKRGLCPITCYPIVVNGRVVDMFCICDCTHPIPETVSAG